MKKILGLDIGTTSVGWALVNEAENDKEVSAIIDAGVRIVPLSTDEQRNFEQGKSITTNAERTGYRSARRNLQRYKLRRDNLIEILKEYNFIDDETLLSEDGNRTTFETYRLRAKAAKEKISLSELARVLLMINKKRGYKSSRKLKNEDEGNLIDGIDIAKMLYEENLTPAQLTADFMTQGKPEPEFYGSDLQLELDKIWDTQSQFYPNILTTELYEEIKGKAKNVTWAILGKAFGLVGLKLKGTSAEKKKQLLEWRERGLSEKLNPEELALTIQDLNGRINNASGYLGAISDRSKELFFNKQTVGQYLMSLLDADKNTSLKNRVFYRMDYLNEFNAIWEKQAEYHPELTDELKKEIRDVIIFYQRRLKSQKKLLSFCEFESRQIEVEVDGKMRKVTTGNRVIPRSSPLFQEFRLWQAINNLIVTYVPGKKKIKRANDFYEDNSENRTHIPGERPLYEDEKIILANELMAKKKMTDKEVLNLLFDNSKEYSLNIKQIEGNRTVSELFGAFEKILIQSGHDIDFGKLSTEDILETMKEIFNTLGIPTNILEFDSEKDLDSQPLYKLWHLLYSYEGDNSETGTQGLIRKLQEEYNLEKRYAAILANVTFEPDYGSLSAKAIRKILPYLKDGMQYDKSCAMAGYTHSKSSLTKEQIENKVLVERLEILPKNSLRNPVVEKILNQLINVINEICDTYGKPQEIRIELARELKKNAKERKELVDGIGKSTKENARIAEILKNKYGMSHPTKNDIIRYRLWEELDRTGYKTLYSNTEISPADIFSKNFDIDHIIPQSLFFDDSFSNKTLERKEDNIKKGNKTAVDYVKSEYGEEALKQYEAKIDRLHQQNVINTSKKNKLLMHGRDIPTGFIERDLRDTQYIAKKAKEILGTLVPVVLTTTGKITDRLRQDWQLVDVMKELNWDKFNALGMTEIIKDRDGREIHKIVDWNKRNDHRHHAMDAITIAFTRRSHIQYLNNLNARRLDEKDSISSKDEGDADKRPIELNDVNDMIVVVKHIERKELYRDKRNKLKFKPPMPLGQFRAEVKKHLQNILISIKAKNKVVTSNINVTKKKGGVNRKKELTPRGQLHKETVYGMIKNYVVKEVKIDGKFDAEMISLVCKPKYRELLLKRLQENDNNPKKAFTGKNSLEKSPIFLDDLHTDKIPSKVKIKYPEVAYTIRKNVDENLKINDVVDKKIKEILNQRLLQFNNDSKKAFSNLDENPIWLNKEKGITIKRVVIAGPKDVVALHEKKDKDGKLIFSNNENEKPTDFVQTRNNHHVAIFEDEKGDLQTIIVSFMETVTRINNGLPAVDKEYRKDEGWNFLFTLKQNEYFVFPNATSGFDPSEIDLFNEDNYSIISPNLFRVQKITLGNYVFRHHLETTIETVTKLKGITWQGIRSNKDLKNIIKVRINHLGKIVAQGEY